MKASVIVPTTTGGLSYLAALMPCLARESGIEVIIIDNNSMDGTPNYLQNWDCTLKINKTKMNFSQSNNYGASIAKSDNLLFLNNDTMPDEGFVDSMLNTLNRSEAIPVGAVGNLLCLLNEPKKVQHAGICFTQDYVPYELGQEVPDHSPGIPYNDPRVRSVREVPSVTAACVMIRRDIFNLVGGFDEEYNNGWEDTDLMLKIKEKGFSIWYTGEKRVLHKKHGTRGRFLSEGENRKRYDDIWVHTGRAKEVIGNRREM